MTQGCQPSTDPDAELFATGAVYAPAADHLDVIRGETVVLQARAEGVGSFQTVFTRGESVLSSTEELRYAPQTIGRDSILATVTYHDNTSHHLWRLQVTGQAPGLPPRPRDLEVIITDRVYVTWTGEPGYDGEVPLNRYELRARPRGYVDEENWDTATTIGVLEFSPDREFYLAVISVGPPALPIGTPVGFALRLIDEGGGMSPAARDDTYIPPGMIIEGTVTNLAGDPLENIEVRWSYADGRTFTDAQGRYRSYLLPRHEIVSIRYSDDGVGVAGTGDYYDVAIEWRVESEQVQDIILIPATNLDSECGSLRYAGEFLNFLRDVTLTDPSIYQRAEFVTSRWENPPISVHVAEHWNDEGTFALHALADSAIATWNERLGEAFFVAAADAGSAQLIIYFDNSSMGNSLAVTRIIDPVNGDLNGDTPLKMSIQSRTSFTQSTMAFEVMLHELAHTFCIAGHSRCHAGVHLLQANPIGIIAQRWPESPISDDEVNLVRTIYALPGDHPLDIYRVD
jgi:hypothetical protein